jgi:hypothetical protein
MKLMSPPDSASAVERRYCYGVATEEAVREFVAEQGDNGSYDMPYLRALLNLLEANGHAVNDIRKELDRVASIVYASRDAFYPKPRAVAHGA